MFFIFFLLNMASNNNLLGFQDGKSKSISPGGSTGLTTAARQPSTGITSERLPSIKKRDLTLGAHNSKKIFTPNVSAPRKVKKDESNTIASKEPPFSDRLLKQSPRPGGVGKEHGRGSGGGRAREVIASASIFSMGPGLKNTGRSENVFSSGQRSGIVENVMRSEAKTGHSKVESFSGNRLLSNQAKAEVLHLPENDMDTEEAGENDFFNFSQTPPIRLPLDYTTVSSRKKEQQKSINKIMPNSNSEPALVMDGKGVKVASEIVTEIKDELKLDEMETSTTQPTVTKTATRSVTEPKGRSPSVSNILTKKDDPKVYMIVMQLPDTLPGEKGETLESESPEIHKSGHFLLKDVTESGRIGKLKIHKSGKVKFHIGNVAMDVEMGMPSCFRQDVVSMDTEEGDLVHLGVVSHKLIGIPNFEQFL